MARQNYFTISLLIAIGTLAFFTAKNHPARAIGCDTQERISGDISNSCSDVSTEDFRENYRRKYRACLAISLDMAIADYNANWKAFNADSPEKLTANTLEKIERSDEIKLSLDDINFDPTKNRQIPTFCY